MKRISFILILLWMKGLHSLAYPVTPEPKAPDSLLPVSAVWNVKKEEAIAIEELTDIEQTTHLTRNARKTLSRLLGFSGYRVPFLNARTRSRLFLDLANVTARLKLYGITMKCYSQAEHPAGGLDTDTFLLEQLSHLDTSSSMVNYHAPLLSPATRITDILTAFDDGKPVYSYALLVHVKQPVAGKRRSFHRINNVGHMFITLIKYNRDSSVVCRSFGFYPKKSNLLSATPLHPASPSVIRDDTDHEWDEVAGKFISARRFNKLLETLQSYDHISYHLSHNNCTDFGLTMARLGGIDIAGTIGHWPLGKGNNPGSAGQSMLEGKLGNTDEEYKDALFVTNTVLPGHQ